MTVGETRLLIGTHNRGKQAELRDLLADLECEILTPAEVGIADEVAETRTEYTDNARSKAIAYAQQSGLWTLSDDSGLEVDVLQGAPGPRSARLAGEGKSDADRRALLLQMLAGHPRPWKAEFRAAVALASPQGSVDLAEGRCAGEIIPVERGTGGFGYDSIFLVDGADQTMAELSAVKKNQISHRALAVAGIKPVLLSRLGLK
ncbi:MAG: non-canonical purine NTP pyrophosphatase [Nitrospiraceae bacterium]